MCHTNSHYIIIVNKSIDFTDFTETIQDENKISMNLPPARSQGVHCPPPRDCVRPSLEFHSTCLPTRLAIS